MDHENSKKIEVSVTMEQFIIRDPKETENEYRVRVWKSRELWDYVQIEWKEEDMEDGQREDDIEEKQKRKKDFGERREKKIQKRKYILEKKILTRKKGIEKE